MPWISNVSDSSRLTVVTNNGPKLRVIALETRVIALELRVIAIELRVIALELRVIALELRVIAHELRVVALQVQFVYIQKNTTSPQESDRYIPRGRLQHYP